MNTNNIGVTSDGPVIEPSLILEFLVKRCNEFIQSENPRFPFLLQGLALAGLATDKDLIDDYKALLASPILPPKEIIRRAGQIFQLALERDPDGRHSQHPNEQTEGDRPLDEKASRHVMMNAYREAKIMIEQADYRHAKIVEMLGWISLQGYPEWLAEFEQVRSTFADDPEEMIKRGREILRDALFRRRPSGRVRPSSN
jgi:hypothetical protein